MTTDLYENVTSFQSLIDLNVRYLRGEKIDVPYNTDSVDEETIPLLSKLIRINQAGFFSMEGQPATNEIEWFKPSDTLYKTYKYCQAMQKSYIKGFVRRDVADRLAVFLRTQPVYFEMIKFKPFQELVNTFPSSRYVLTRGRCGTKKADQVKQSWDNYTIWSPLLVESESHLHYFTKYPRIESLLKRGYVETMIVGLQYGEGSVEDVLLSFFDAQGTATTKPQVRPLPQKRPSPPVEDVLLSFFDAQGTGKPKPQVRPPQKKRPHCPPGKIINPRTNRCVNIDGKIGKQVLQEQRKRR